MVREYLHIQLRPTMTPRVQTTPFTKEEHRFCVDPGPLKRRRDQESLHQGHDLALRTGGC